MNQFKKTIFSFLTILFISIGFLRIITPILNLYSVDLAIKPLTLSASSYLFDKKYWFYGHRITETDSDNKEVTYDLDYKNFGEKIKGSYERRDLMIHSIAWSSVTDKIFAQQAFQYYICDNFYGINTIKKIRYDFTYKKKLTGITQIFECLQKEDNE